MAAMELARKSTQTVEPGEAPETEAGTVPRRNGPPGPSDLRLGFRYRVPASTPCRSRESGPTRQAPEAGALSAGAEERPDALFVEQCLGGQREAFAELVKRHQHAVFRMALGLMRDREAAEDLAQDTFVQAFRRLSTFDARYRFRNWLLTICANRGKNRIRSRVRRRKALELYALERALAARAPAGFPDRDLRRLLERIPEKLRVPLLLKHGEGLSYDEIAGILKIGTSAAKMRVKRGRDSLVSLLQARRDEDGR